jgi:bla regulator protein blaR1
MSWWQYLVLVNFYLFLFYGFYALLLRRETFFQLNRLYLVSSSILSFIIPAIHSEWARNLFITQKVQHTFFSYGSQVSVYQLKPIEDRHITIGQILLCIYAIGTLILAIKFIWQLITLKKVIDEPENTGDFSFFKAIRVGDNSVDDQKIITAHEQAHANQWHSIDIVLIETIAIINWFNPVVYSYRLAIKHIHEFIADKQALNDGTDKTEYALLLLSQAFKAPAHKLVNPFFNESLLKRRIFMLQKSRSKYTALLKYGLSAPLFLGMLILSEAAISKSETIKMISKKAEEVLQLPAATFSTHVSAPQKAIQVPQPTAVKEEVKQQPAEITEAPLITLEGTGNPPRHKADDDNTELTIVEQQPEFKGGMGEFYKFLKSNLQYTPRMMSHDVQGKVIIQLTVEKDGSLTDIKAVHDIGCGAADEAIRVLKLSPKWQPGYQNGESVKVKYTLPIAFNLVKLNSPDDTITKKVELPAKMTIIPDTTRNSRMVLWDNSTCPPDALYVLDGKPISDLGEVNPEAIETIRIFRKLTTQDYLVKLFGPKALNGVVLIKTKAKTEKASSVSAAN